MLLFFCVSGFTKKSVWWKGFQYKCLRGEQQSLSRNCAFRIWGSHVVSDDSYQEKYMYGLITEFCVLFVGSGEEREELKCAVVRLYRSPVAHISTGLDTVTLDESHIYKAVQYIPITAIDSPVIFAPHTESDNINRFFVLPATVQFDE